MRGLWEGKPSSFFPRSPAARRTDPLTEGLEQASPFISRQRGLSNSLINEILISIELKNTANPNPKVIYGSAKVH